MFGLYWFLLRREKLFVFNRFFLIFSLIFSLIIPFISIPISIRNSEVQGSILSVINTNIPEIVQNQSSIEPMLLPSVINPALKDQSESINYIAILIILYVSGVILFLFRFSRNMFLIFQLRRLSEKIKYQGYYLALTEKQVNPFCFFNTIYINKQDFFQQRVAEELIKHEIEHANQLHSVDIMIIELIRIFYWFNPVLILYNRAARINHEYLADNGVVQYSLDAQRYAHELINFVCYRRNIQLTSGFNVSLIKKRIIMLTKPRSKMTSYSVRVSALLISVAVLFIILSCVLINSQANGSILQQKTRVDGIVLDEQGNPVGDVTILSAGTLGESLFTVSGVDGHFRLPNVPPDAKLIFQRKEYKRIVIKPEFTSEMKIVMPKETSRKKDEFIIIGYGDGSTATEPIRVVNATDGSPVDALIVIDGAITDKKHFERINSKDITSISVQKDPSVTAVYGEKRENGIILVTTKRVSYALDGVIIESQDEVSRIIRKGIASIMTRLTAEKAIIKYGEVGKNGLYELMSNEKAEELGIKFPLRPYMRRNPEDYPTFKGGNSLLYAKWIIDQVKYPAEAALKGICGHVTVTYTISADGSVRRMIPAWGSDSLLAAPVVKVMQSSPKWDPAKNPEAREDYYSEVIVRFELPDKVTQDDTFSSVEDMPQYPGGDVALRNYIKLHIRYPEVAKTKKIEGTVIVRFIVRVDGNAEEASVIKSIHPLLDAEAVRVVSTVSGWKAGMQEGKPVNVYSIVPVTFSLPETELSK